MNGHRISLWAQTVSHRQSRTWSTLQRFPSIRILPTQSSNQSLTMEPGTEFIDAGTGGRKSDFRPAETGEAALRDTKVPFWRDKCDKIGRSSVSMTGMVGATGIEPVTPSM